jgi:hypothetical protein
VSPTANPVRAARRMGSPATPEVAWADVRRNLPKGRSPKRGPALRHWWTRPRTPPSGRQKPVRRSCSRRPPFTRFGQDRSTRHHR